MIRSHKIKLDPTCKQEEFFRQCVDNARSAYNWALREWRDQYAAGLKPNDRSLRRQFNGIKREKFPWMLLTPKSVVQQAIMNLGIGYKNYFDSCRGRRAGAKVNPPDFKSRFSSKQSARLDNGPDTFWFEGKYVELPKIGIVKMREELRFDGKPLCAVVSYYGGCWWLSVRVELPDPIQAAKPIPSVGIDLGITTAVTLSDGTTYQSPKPLKVALERLRRRCRSVSRKAKDSSNHKKAKQKLAKLHAEIAQIRKDWLHKTTTAIAKQYGQVGLENLAVRSMMKNRSLSRAMGDIGFFEFRRQLEYKANKVVAVDRRFPSSKICSGCGHKKTILKLSERIFKCEKCGLEVGRDLNAAINIHTESCSGINACGDGSSGLGPMTETKLPPTKQELDRAPVAQPRQRTTRFGMAKHRRSHVPMEYRKMVRIGGVGKIAISVVDNASTIDASLRTGSGAVGSGYVALPLPADYRPPRLSAGPGSG